MKKIGEEIEFTERLAELVLGMVSNTPGKNYIAFLGP